MKLDVIVIGAGAAGMLAAAAAAERGLRTLLLEKNSKPGVKVLISGGTRCNLTHATDAQGIADVFPRDQARFLRGPLAALGPDALLDLFHALGVATKVEATGKVFPTSDRALDVQRALVAHLKNSGAELSLGEPVIEIEPCDGDFSVVTSNRTIVARQVILTTGGQSYPGCGTTGDGYVWAKNLGHRIIPPRPALVPVKTETSAAAMLQGVTLPKVGISVHVTDSRQTVAKTTNSLLFTHFGLSGPGILDVSRELTLPNRSLHDCMLRLDLLPDVKGELLDVDLLDQSARDGRRQLATFLTSSLPRSVVDAMLGAAGIPSDRTFAELARNERRRCVTQLKQWDVPVQGTLGFAKAEVTAGGVSLDEIDSRTMQSKLCPGLFLAGEILDIDGPIGGYNFQAAFSTGWLAGNRGVGS
jgi:predicted Rossmann fold flavoprotein